MSNLDRVMKWIALDFDGHSWIAIALWLFAAQVVLFLIALAIDAIWFPVTSYGFFAAMLLFAAYVFLDALQVGFSFSRAVLWGSVVTIGWIFGAIPYARRRQHRRRGQAVSVASPAARENGHVGDLDIRARALLHDVRGSPRWLGADSAARRLSKLLARQARSVLAADPSAA